MAVQDIAQNAGLGALDIGMGAHGFSRAASAGTSAAAKSALEGGVKAGVRLLPRIAKVATPVGAAMFVAEGSGYVADAIAGAAYSAQGRDFEEERKQMAADCSRGVNLVSAGLDMSADMWDNACFGLADILHKTVAEPLGSVVKDIPGIGEPLMAVGGGIEWVGSALAGTLGATVDGVKEVSNVVGMQFGARPVEKNEVLREDEKARSELIETLSKMEQDGFAAEGTLDAILSSRDSLRGLASCGYEDILQDVKNAEQAYTAYKQGDTSAVAWNPEDGPYLDAAYFRVLDTGPYLSGMTDDMAKSLWDTAYATGLASKDAKGDEYALLGSEEVKSLQEAVSSGKMSYAESAAYLAAYMDYYGAFESEGVTEALSSHGFYDAVEASRAEGNAVHSAYTSPEARASDGYVLDAGGKEMSAGTMLAEQEAQAISEEDGRAYINLGVALGVFDENYAASIDKAVGEGVMTYAEVAEQLQDMYGDEIDRRLSQLDEANTATNTQAKAEDALEMM